LSIATILITVFVSPAAMAVSEQLLPWVLVDTKMNKIALMKGRHPFKTFENASIGRNGASKNRVMGDNKTPIGQYTINSIRRSDRYHKFLGINYPSLKQAQLALDKQIITFSTYSKIKNALEAGRTPPQYTKLGGNLGIHGLGKANLSIHESFNWTNGCIALTDKQLDELTKFVQII